jgi:hypothetical protein
MTPCVVDQMRRVANVRRSREVAEVEGVAPATLDGTAVRFSLLNPISLHDSGSGGGEQVTIAGAVA